MEVGKKINIMRFFKALEPTIKLDRKVVFDILDGFISGSMFEFYSKKTEEIMEITGITKKQLLTMIRFGQMYHLLENIRLPRLQIQQQSDLIDIGYEELTDPFYKSFVFDKKLKNVAEICVYVFRFFIFLFRYEKMEHNLNQNHDDYFLSQAKDKWEELLFYTLELTEIEDNLYILEEYEHIINEYYSKFKKLLRVIEPVLSNYTYSVSNNFMYDSFIVMPWVYGIYKIL